MIDVATALYNIMHAVYGEEVRQSLHDGLYEVNQNSLEAVAKAIGIAIDSTITSTTSSSTGYVTRALVLNNVSWDFWKCTGTNTWALQGNIKGAPGEQGEPGAPGEDGTPGSIFHKGTGITGTSETPTIFSGSGVALANVTDVYLNTATGILYQCTTGGIATVAEWIWLMTFGEAGAVVWSTLAGKPFSTVGTSGLKIATDILDVDLAKIERKASTLTSKATVVLTDEMVITDSADSSISKRSPLSALKALFQNHFVTVDTEQTISLPKAFAQGLIAYGKTTGSLPTGLGAYVTAYVDPTHGARLLSYDGAAYQPISIGALVSAGKFSMKLLADGNLEINGITIFVPRATAPTVDLAEGMVYYDSVAKVLKTYNGTTWVSGGGSGTVINDGSSNPIATTTLIDTLTGIVSNTTENQVAGALAVKTLEDRFTYSSTEKIVGTWIDGKSIYRKIYSASGLNLTSPTVVDANFKLSSVDTIIDMKSDFKTPSEYTGNYTDIITPTVYSVRTRLLETGLLLQISNDTVTKYSIIIDYTKP